MIEEFEYVENSKNIKVKTPSGFQKFKGIRKLQKQCMRIDTTTEFIECSVDHPLYNKDREIKAEELLIGSEIQMDGKTETVEKIEFIGEKEVYDLIGVNNGHRYYTNNMISHNCSFEGSSYTLINGKHLSSLAHKQALHDSEDLFGTKIYEEPIEGHTYMIGVDTAKYGEGDYLSIQVIDVTDKPFIQVASFRQRDITYLNLVEPMFEIANYYNEAFVFVENNSGDGQSAVDLLVENYDYDNVYTEKAGVWGFRTTTKSRRIGLQNLKQLVEDGMLKLNDEETLAELMRFALKNGKYQATDGYNDDAVMAVVAALFFLQVKGWVDSADLHSFFKGESDINDDDSFVFGFIDDGSGAMIPF